MNPDPWFMYVKFHIQNGYVCQNLVYIPWSQEPWSLVPEPWTVPIRTVPGSWIAVIGPSTWTLIPGSWCLDRGSWARSLGCYAKHNILCCSGRYRAAANTTYCVYGSWSLIPGSWFLVPGAWSLVPGSRFMVHGSWSRSHPPHTPHPLYMPCVCRWLKAEFLRLITINFFYFFIKVLYFCLNSVLHCLWKKGIL